MIAAQEYYHRPYRDSPERWTIDEDCIFSNPMPKDAAIRYLIDTHELSNPDAIDYLEFIKIDYLDSLKTAMAALFRP